MPIVWDEPDEAQREFERAAIEAASGYIYALDQLYDALIREAKLKAQLAALIGLEGKRK